MEIEVKNKLNIDINKESLHNAISNALFIEFTKEEGNKKKLLEMDLWNLSTYIPEIIANQIITNIKNIIIIKQGDN